MNTRDVRFLRAEQATLESLIKQLPASSVIERQGLEFRKRKVEEALAGPEARDRQPAQLRLTFRGKDNLFEEELNISGRFRGALPARREFEFLNGESGEVMSGKIDTSIKDVDAINEVLDRPVRIRVHARRVGRAQARYVLLAYEATSGRGSELT